MIANRLDEYMNAPEISDEPMPLREVHAIRLMIYDDIKDMTSAERKAYYTTGLDDICRQFNIEIVPSAN